MIGMPQKRRGSRKTKGQNVPEEIRQLLARASDLAQTLELDRERSALEAAIKRAVLCANNIVARTTPDVYRRQS